MLFLPPPSRFRAGSNPGVAAWFWSVFTHTSAVYPSSIPLSSSQHVPEYLAPHSDLKATLSRVCVPLWPAAYAISISTRLYMWTNNNTSLFGFFLEVIHIYCILFTHLCTLSSLYGESFLPTVLPATTFRSLSPGLKCEESVVESLARNFSQRSGWCVMKQAWRKELESMRLINCA